MPSPSQGAPFRAGLPLRTGSWRGRARRRPKRKERVRHRGAPLSQLFLSSGAPCHAARWRLRNPPFHSAHSPLPRCAEARCSSAPDRRLVATATTPNATGSPPSAVASDTQWAGRAYGLATPSPTSGQPPSSRQRTILRRSPSPRPPATDDTSTQA